MAYLFLQGVEPHSAEAGEILSLLKKPPRKDMFPHGFLTSTRWEEVLVTQSLPAAVNGLPSLAPGVSSQSLGADSQPHVASTNQSAPSSNLSADAPVFVPGKIWSTARASSVDRPVVAASPQHAPPTAQLMPGVTQMPAAAPIQHCPDPPVQPTAAALNFGVTEFLSPRKHSGAEKPSASQPPAATSTDKPVSGSAALQFGDVHLDSIVKSKEPVTKPAKQEVDLPVSVQSTQCPVEEKAVSVEAPPVQTPEPAAVDRPGSKTPPSESQRQEKSKIPEAQSPPTPQPSVAEAAMPATPKQPPPPKVWASLFNKEASASPSLVIPPDTPKTQVATAQPPAQPASQLGALLENMVLLQTAVSVAPRRLINRANWCYINATLQALIACPPFYHMLKALPPPYPALGAPRSLTPVLDAMVEFAYEFNPPPQDKRRVRNELRCDKAYEPAGIYEALPEMQSALNSFQRGRQEDAEEFLTCLLNTLSDEMKKAIDQNKEARGELPNGNGHASADEGEDDSGWSQVGPKKKAVKTRDHTENDSKTPISDIFGGCMRSSLTRANGQPESATLERFFAVPLNVETARSVEEALQAFVSKEYIEGYTCPDTKQKTDAHRELTFHQLPTILILHLKCFVYKEGGSLKVRHTMQFRENLVFDKELLSPLARKRLSLSERSYKLFAVVYHSGEKTTGGHYHTDVFLTGETSWVRFDDDSVQKISLPQVFEKRPLCVPYLLYYKRVDKMQPPSSPAATNNGAK